MEILHTTENSVEELAVGKNILQGAVHFPPRGTPMPLNLTTFTKLVG